MRRLVLAAALAVLAVAVAPIASASAASDILNGKCEVEGTATFGTEIGLNALTLTTYTFVKTEAKCTGEAERENKTAKSTGPFEVLVAKVETGKGELECGTNSKDGVGAGEDGNFERAIATIKVKETGGEKREYEAKSYFRFKAAKILNTKLELVPVPGEIVAELNNKKGGGGANEAKGFANFVVKGGATSAKECAAGKAVTLPFETKSEPQVLLVREVERLLLGGPNPNGLEGKIGPLE